MQLNDSRSNLLLSRGYGFIPYAVMADRRLSGTAKQLYCYLSSLAGRDGVVWPSVDRICCDMNMGPAAFRAALRGLVELGYVSVRRVKERGRFSHSVYTLLDTAADSPAAGNPPSEEPPADHPPMEEPSPSPSPASEPPLCRDTATNTTVTNTTVTNTTVTGFDEDEASALVACAGARKNPWDCLNGITDRDEMAQRASEISAGEAVKWRKINEGNRMFLRLAFDECFSRQPLPAETELLSGLLGWCDQEAMLRVIRIAAEHAPRSPAPYIRRVLLQYRADARRYNLISGFRDLLTDEILARVDARNDGFLVGG